jgi:hypothetical protein
MLKTIIDKTMGGGKARALFDRNYVGLNTNIFGLMTMWTKQLQSKIQQSQLLKRDLSAELMLVPPRSIARVVKLAY